MRKEGVQSVSDLDGKRWEITKIIQNNNKVLFSNNNFFELITLGYTKYEINSFLNPFRKSIYYVWSTEKQFRKAKDLALKRNIPKREFQTFFIILRNEV